MNGDDRRKLLAAYLLRAPRTRTAVRSWYRVRGFDRATTRLDLFTLERWGLIARGDVIDVRDREGLACVATGHLTVTRNGVPAVEVHPA